MKDAAATGGVSCTDARVANSLRQSLLEIGDISIADVQRVASIKRSIQGDGLVELALDACLSGTGRGRCRGQAVALRETYRSDTRKSDMMVESGAPKIRTRTAVVMPVRSRPDEQWNTDERCHVATVRITAPILAAALRIV
jgi:hypothetical protein